MIFNQVFFRVVGFVCRVRSCNSPWISLYSERYALTSHRLVCYDDNTASVWNVAICVYFDTLVFAKVFKATIENASSQVGDVPTNNIFGPTALLFEERRRDTGVWDEVQWSNKCWIGIGIERGVNDWVIARVSDSLVITILCTSPSRWVAPKSSALLWM
jgi:hypothetical protein